MTTHDRAHEVSLRAAGPGDLPLLGRMLCLAADPDGPGLDAQQAAGDPELARYVLGWPRLGDTGVIAQTPRGELVGAAWVRIWSPEDRGYGYISPSTPELAMAIEHAWRGLGWGGTILDALLSSLRTRGVGSVSLTVRDTNTSARAMYDARGFVPVGRVKESSIMLLVL